MADKSTNKAIVREQFFTLGKLNQRATEIKNAYRKALSNLEAQRETYSSEYLEKQRADAEQAMKTGLLGLHNEFTGQAEKLFNALTELHGMLDLADPKLQTALTLINSLGTNLVGSDLETSTVEKINAQFAGDQSALKILRSAYQAKGVPFTGDLDSQIYNLIDAVHQITTRANEAFIQAGSINNLAAAEAKIAGLEGYSDFERLPDPVGFDEAVFRGAGL